MAQHQHGHLSEKQMIQICKSHDPEIWSKFSKDSAGLYFQERLDFEVERRRLFTESRSNNKKGKLKSYENDMKKKSSSYGKRMENETENKTYTTIDFKESFLSDQQFIETACMANKIDEPKLKELLETFTSTKIAIGHQWKDYSDFKTHFLYWIPTYISKLDYERNGKNRKNGKDQTVTKPADYGSGRKPFGKLIK